MSENQRVIAGRYTLGSLIGRGGMADVYEGTDTILGRKVAIKLLKADLAADPSFESRFREEAQASARMAHPTIVRVYDTGEESSIDDNGTERRTPYIVMEYVRGTLLRDLMHERRISTPEAIGYAEGILTALEFSHKAGIIHRDIKSANIMITDTGVVKVMDFGIARTMSDGSATQAHTAGIVGTAQYFSPEQARGESVDARTDLYSTGVVLYEMLAGRPPFTGETAVSVAYQHVSEAVTPPSVFNPELSAALDQVVLQSLAKDRNERFQSAEEFREHLLAASLAPITSAAPVVVEEQAPAIEEEPETTIEDLFAPEEVIETAVEEVVEAPTEAFTPTTDTNPFATIGVEFETIEDGEEFKPTKTKSASQKPSPGLLWGIGSGLSVVLVGLLVWLLAFGGGGFTNFHPTEGGNAVFDVTGMSFADAKAKLATQNLVVSEQFEVSDTVNPDAVIRTDPPAGTKVADGTMVTLYVSSGKTQATVPNVAGMTEAEAKLALENAHLTLGTITEGTSPTIVKGQVISTDPASGLQVAQGSVVNLLISNGQVMVPDVTGKGLSEAKRILSGPDVGLIVDVSSSQPCANGAAPLGVIVRQQSVPAGLVDAGSSITIYVDCTQ
ncbi:MAG: Stk1 family PASTA domain-containing Ser/Thr kinase [Rhodoluna sp.]|nr:Stk1 family PASTA domain-containing Ser/Thr kinase [Rhodoluna sp.]